MQAGEEGGLRELGPGDSTALTPKPVEIEEGRAEGSLGLWVLVHQATQRNLRLQSAQAGKDENLEEVELLHPVGFNT